MTAVAAPTTTPSLAEFSESDLIAEIKRRANLALADMFKAFDWNDLLDGSVYYASASTPDEQKARGAAMLSAEITGYIEVVKNDPKQVLYKLTPLGVAARDALLNGEFDSALLS